jgi:sterol desaturase/sphingolipid hydroxylase (fatty acid hydroxylase superfamily)
MPIGLAGIALKMQEDQFGLFFRLQLPEYLEIFLSILILDLAIYFQHILFHKISFLWPLHRVHHSDIDLDFTSALRFHPLEIIFSFGYKLLFIYLFGISFLAVLIFEIILNFIAMFNHSNINIHTRFEGILRLFVVTPQMHIIHHSIKKNESDSNFGFNLSIWDRLFKTYTKKFISNGRIGNSRFQKSEDQKIIELIKQPFL